MALLVLGCGLALGWDLWALPFSGPYRGLVLDEASGKPIAGVEVEAAWWCHDNPWPDGPGHYYIYARRRTDAAGAFRLAPPARRRGLFGTSFSLQVRAPGYIDAALIVAPGGPPLPESTLVYPFQTTTQHEALPAALTVKLKPALPVIQKFLHSDNPVYRNRAEELLRKTAPRRPD